MVVMEKQDYTDKALTLLGYTSIYNIINKDPTTRLRNSLITKVKDIKQKGGLSDTIYRKMYPTSADPLSFMTFLKSTKLAPPLRPSVASRSSITYGVAKELAGIISPLVGQSPHHLKNTQHFVQHIQKARPEPREVMASYDVKALLTSVPSDPSIKIVQQNYNTISHYPTGPTCPFQKLSHRWSSVLKTYFLFQGKYYEEVHGAAMGSPISPLIANLFMEEWGKSPWHCPTHTIFD